MLLRTEFGARPNPGASASSVSNGSLRESSNRSLADTSLMGGSRLGRSHGGLEGNEAATVSAAGENKGYGREEQEDDKKVHGEKDDHVGKVSLSASASMSPSASASALRPAPESASAFVLVPELASALADEEEKDGGCVGSSSWRNDRAPTEEWGQRGTVAPQSQGSGDVGREGAEDAVHGSRTRRRKESGEEEKRREGVPAEKEKPAATVIGEVLGRLPLSKLKIVIGD